MLLFDWFFFFLDRIWSSLIYYYIHITCRWLTTGPEWHKSSICWGIAPIEHVPHSPLLVQHAPGSQQRILPGNRLDMRQFLLINWTFIICPTGTTVWSDRWAADVNLTAVTGLAHATVNHSVAFVAPNGVRKNGVENLWRCAKDKFTRMMGTSDELIASYLDEFLWHRRQAFMLPEALELIREYYPVWISPFKGYPNYR